MKNCKICGAVNNDTAIKCSACNYEFEIQEPSKSSESVGLLEKPLWMFVGLGISALLLITYTAYILNTETYTYAYIIYPLLSTAIVILGAYWVSIEVRNRKALKQQKTKNTELVQQPSDELSERCHGISFTQFLHEKVQLAKTEYQAPAYDDAINCKRACETLRPNGYVPSADCARLLLAALASRRATVLCVKDSGDVTAVHNALSAATGFEPAIVSLEIECKTPNDLYTCQKDNENYPSEFLYRIVMGDAKAGAISPVILTVASVEGIDAAFSEMNEYLATPYAKGTVVVKNANRRYKNCSSDETITLPENGRLILVLTPEQVNLMPSLIMKNCAFVDMKCESNFNESQQTLPLSFARLNYLADDSQESYYLTEGLWKKIDSLVSHINQTVSFVLDNKLAVSMERYVGVYMASGASENEALDAVLSSLLLPGALAQLASCPKDDRVSLSQYMDSQFGLDNLPLCTEILKKFSDA